MVLMLSDADIKLYKCLSFSWTRESSTDWKWGDTC